jgi:hypothetical protein
VIEIADDDSLDIGFREGKDGEMKQFVDHEAINRSRLKVDARKWKAAKLAPRKYGDKIEATVGGGDNPIQLFMAAVSNTTASLIGEQVPLDDEEPDGR